MDAEINLAADRVNLPIGFPDIPSDWRWAPLAESCTGIYDCPHSTPELTSSGPYLVRTQDYTDGVLKLDKMARVSEETYADRVRRAVPQRGDILYSREGSYHGIAAEVPFGHRVCMGQRMVLIRPNSNVLNFRFLRYWLNSSYVRDFIEGMREGSGAPRINMPTIRELLTPLPPIGEQNSVARLLGALDDKIAVNERIAATADELVLAIASSERWEARIPLGEICTLRKDQISPAEISEPQVDHYSLPAFDSQKRPERTSPGTIKSGKFLVATPAVLFSKLNPEIPRVWNVTPANAVPALASTEFLVLTPRGDVSTHELWAVTAQQDFREVVAARVTGTSKSHQRVRPTDVLAAEVVDPRRFGAVQQQINSLALSALAARKESVVLASLRDTLLPQITSGRLRVKEAEMIIEDHA